MGLSVPYIYFMHRPSAGVAVDLGNSSQHKLSARTKTMDLSNMSGARVGGSGSSDPRVKKRTMRDFVGMEKVAAETKQVKSRAESRAGTRAVVNRFCADDSSSHVLSADGHKLHEHMLAHIMLIVH